MEDAIKTYRLKTGKSAKLFEKSKKYHVDTSRKIQNPVDPAGPDCYRINTKPCEFL